MMILNLTQHESTASQLEAGVFDTPNNGELSSLLTFNELPTKKIIEARAKKLAFFAVQALIQEICFRFDLSPLEDEDEIQLHLHHENQVMIGGAPYLMSSLEDALKYVDLVPMYAYSKRESVDKHNADGSVTKSMVFNHLGFVEA